MFLVLILDGNSEHAANAWKNRCFVTAFDQLNALRSQIQLLLFYVNITIILCYYFSVWMNSWIMKSKEWIVRMPSSIDKKGYMTS